MGIRPKVSHVVGFSTETIFVSESWNQNFTETYNDEEFIVFANDILDQVETEEEWRERYRQKFEGVAVSEVVTNFELSRIKVFGMRPFFHYKQSELYDHGMIWAMLESGMIDDQTQAIKIPYKDWSNYIGMEPKAIVDSFEDFDEAIEVVRAMEHYKGKWARKYPNHPANIFDRDFDFALALFKKLGFDVKETDLERYLIIEWA